MRARGARLLRDSFQAREHQPSAAIDVVCASHEDRELLHAQVTGTKPIYLQ
jgi:hypothetical protein